MNCTVYAAGPGRVTAGSPGGAGTTRSHGTSPVMSGSAGRSPVTGGKSPVTVTCAPAAKPAPPRPLPTGLYFNAIHSGGVAIVPI